MYNKYLQEDNKRQTLVMLFITALIFGAYIIRLILMVKYDKMRGVDPIEFIRLFNLILAFLAVISCMLSFKSNNKEEIFFIGIMYGVFLLDIWVSNIFDFRSDADQPGAYLAVGTSIIRIIVAVLSLTSWTRVKRYIINNKIKFSIFIIFISLGTTYLEYSKVMFYLKDANSFMIYNIILFISYTSISIIYFIRSLKDNEYIYTIVGSSIFMFATKAIYAIYGELTNSLEIRFTSISITYMGFIIFIIGLFLELTSNIKKNKKLEKELNLFYKIVNENKYSSIIIYNETLSMKYCNESVYNNYNNSEINYYYIGEKLKKEIDCKKNKSGKIFLDKDENVIEYFIQYLEEDNSVYYIVTFRDISLDYKIDKINQQEQIKSEFLANISHELKTPLNIIYSTMQLLNIKIDDDDFAYIYDKYKNILGINCQRMLRLINNIVDITKFDVGYKKIDIKNYDIVSLVEDVTISTINYANMKNINLIFDTEIEQLTIQCDAHMIERVMLNLISNAIKFTKENGNILIHISSNDEYVSIKVIDDGIGIPKKMQPLIFERFVQADKSFRRQNEGSGIGLSIVKSIIDLSNGKINLKSDGINGSEFEVLLPNKTLKYDMQCEKIINKYILDEKKYN